MATEKQITERWGATHEIQKQRLVGEINLRHLNKNESVAMGDGKTFYWLLTEKDVVKNNLVQADVRGQLIAFLRQQTKLHYVSIYENDFEFADKILKAINLP